MITIMLWIVVGMVGVSLAALLWMIVISASVADAQAKKAIDEFCKGG
jgi:hypothetical protein